jgi:small conductance mechanosensitive channel
MKTELREIEQFSDLRKTGEFIIQYGQEILIAAAIFLVALIAVKLLIAWLRKTLPKYTENQYLISMVITVLNVLLIVLVISISLHFLGVKDLVIRRLLVAIALVAVGFIVLLKPFIPTLPFKTGNTIEIEGLIGKVEAMTFTHTRMKTFDGKTLFIPNQMLYKTTISPVNTSLCPAR